MLPGQTFTAESVETLPTLEYHLPREACFAMRHLQLSAVSPTHVLAVLRPLFGGREELAATALHAGDRTVGVHVEAAGLDDRIFHSRNGLQYADDAVTFDGKYGLLLQRPGARTLALLDGTTLAAADLRIASDGPAVHVTETADGIEIVAEGIGRFTVHHGAEEFTADNAGRMTYQMGVRV